MRDGAALGAELPADAGHGLGGSRGESGRREFEDEVLARARFELELLSALRTVADRGREGPFDGDEELKVPVYDDDLTSASETVAPWRMP